MTSAQSAAADQALRDAAAAASSPAGETTAAPLQGWNTEPQSLGREVLGAGAGSARMRGDGRLPASARAALPAPGHDDPGTSPAQGMPLAPTLASDQRPREKNAASGSIAMSQADSVAAAAVAPDAPSTPSSDAAGAPGPHIVAPAVGSPDWAAAIAQHLARAAGSRDIELHLNPQELGPLKVKLSLLAGQAQLAFVSEHLPVRQALEAALPQLRSSLADSGISLGQATVASGTGDAMPDHGAGRQQPAPDRGWRSGRPAAPPPAPVRRGSSAVDTFA